MQWREAVVVAGIDIGTLFEQESNNDIEVPNLMLGVSESDRYYPADRYLRCVGVVSERHPDVH